MAGGVRFVPGRAYSRDSLSPWMRFRCCRFTQQDPDGLWGSAYLLDLFGKSGFGKVMFIEEILEGMDSLLSEIVSSTGLPRELEHKKDTRRKLPILPVYKGYITRSTRDSRNMQYLDGYGSVASNGKCVGQGQRVCISDHRGQRFQGCLDRTVM